MLIALLLTLGIATATSFNASAIDNQNSKNKLPDIGISGYSVLSTDKELQIG